MYVYPERAFEDAVVALYVYLLNVGVELLRYYGCYLMEHSHVVDTCNLYGYNKVQLFVCFPFGGKYPVAVAALQCVCY